MKIAIASGKGGTGKTLIATNLAFIAAQTQKVILYDLDVEEPNSEYFFKVREEQLFPVEKMIPVVNEELCDHCGICSQICEYHAIISLADQVLVFPELCHSCYGCLELCPLGAISEGKKEIGTIKISRNQNLRCITGILKIGESATTGLIREVKKVEAASSELKIFDAPPGTSCPVVESVKDMDFIILVAEPTPFGLHDLDLLVQVIQDLKKPFGVVINKSQQENDLISEYCQINDIPILSRIPFSMKIAEAYAQGKLISMIDQNSKQIFQRLLTTINSKVNEVEA